MSGLTTEQVKKLQDIYGKNELNAQKKESFLHKAIHIITEPMFLLLIASATIYFILGEQKDALIMLVSVIVIISIDIIQEWKTDKTLKALKDLSAPHITVIRDSKEQVILSSELVPGDYMIISEGIKVPADGKIIKANDLCIDESSLTGESLGVWKTTCEDNSINTNDYYRKDYCYAGTLVIQGNAVVLVEKTGHSTEYGKIGKTISDVPLKSSPLQKQTNYLVKLCTIIAFILFVLVSVITFFNISAYTLKDRIVSSILSGIPIAMSMIPEEFPVVLTVFLSMGAFRLAKKQSLVKKLTSIETLGAVTVLCVDKTGTITMNKMAITELYSCDKNDSHLCEIMGLACETDAYDPMEKAMLTYCENIGISKEHLFSGNLLHEYAFTNELKMMGHVWEHDGEIIIAAKGSPEKILSICDIPENEKVKIQDKIKNMSKKGLRVIAVAHTKLESANNIPKNITDCRLKLCGVVGLSDPPRKNIENDIKDCLNAGIRVVMITGDNGITASSIAKQVGIPNSSNIVTGEEIEAISDDELKKIIKNVSIFSRVIPEHKMRIVKAFKDNSEIVAMTGDGVNDAPALKYSDIGISMGKRGSEVSREASDLVLMDDNFSTIVSTIKDGRRIYDNIRKSIIYIFAIHVPIALSSLIAPLIGISPDNLLLLPLHVILLELIIDPTCSVCLERQPAESNIMNRKPRDPNEKILTKSSFIKSMFQGFAIFLASFLTYLNFMGPNFENTILARTMGLSIMMLSSLFLVQVNSSSVDSVLYSIKKLSKDKIMWATSIATILLVLISVYSPLNTFLKLTPLTVSQFALAFFIAAVSVLWFEIVKFIRRIKSK